MENPPGGFGGAGGTGATPAGAFGGGGMIGIGVDFGLGGGGTGAETILVVSFFG